MRKSQATILTYMEKNLAICVIPMKENNVLEGKFYFNSIKVRLKHNIVCDEERDFEFQFHKGTIKT